MDHGFFLIIGSSGKINSGISIVGGSGSGSGAASLTGGAAFGGATGLAGGGAGSASTMSGFFSAFFGDGAGFSDLASSPATRALETRHVATITRARLKPI